MVAERLEQCGAPWRVAELRGDESTMHDQRGTKQLLDGANAFGDEEPLSLAGPSALEVAG